jgi:two-component system, NarL family, nitrate/nitrite response regulator NarL
MTRVLVADDHPLMLSGLEAVLRGTAYEIAAKAGNGTEALEAAVSAAPDIFVLDIKMPGRSGLDVLRILRDTGDTRPVVLLTADIADQALVEAIRLGVNGIIMKEGAETQLLACLDRVQAGGRWIEGPVLQRALDLAIGGGKPKGPLARLTNRERAIARLVGEGLRNREIGEELGLTEGTVKVCLHRIYEKLDISNRTELALLDREAGAGR